MLNTLYTQPVLTAAQGYPIPYTPYATRCTLFIMQNKPNFRKSQLNVSNCTTREYEEMDTWSSEENKPNQTQYEPNQTQFPKSPKMNATSLPTKPYEHETAFALEPNKPNQTQFQTQKIQRIYGEAPMTMVYSPLGFCSSSASSCESVPRLTDSNILVSSFASAASRSPNTSTASSRKLRRRYGLS